LEDAWAQRVLDTARNFSVGIEALVSSMKALANGVVAAGFALARESVAKGRFAFFMDGARACLGFRLRAATNAIETVKAGTANLTELVAATTIRAHPSRSARG
jgi:hypothetical protein